MPPSASTVTYLFELKASDALGENENIVHRENTRHTNLSINVSSLMSEAPGTFHWRVRARDSAGALSGEATGSFLFSATDDDDAGPSAFLVFVGTNYQPGATGTNVTDGDLALGGVVDIAVRYSDPSGVWFATNEYHSIGSEAGNVQPNWDLTNAVYGTFGWDVPFTNCITGAGQESPSPPWPTTSWASPRTRWTCPSI